MQITSNTFSATDLASRCGARLKGNGTVIVTGIASIESAEPGSLVFAADRDQFRNALESGASAIVSGDFVDDVSGSKAILVVPDPKLTFAKLAKLFVLTGTREGHDDSAQIHLSAQVGEHTWIGPGVVIEENVSVGEHSSIGANTVVGAGAIVGRNCQIGPNVTIYSGTQLGDQVRVQAGSVLGSTGFGYVRDEAGRYSLFPQVGRLVIEDNVEIGANCTIDRGALDATVIRRGTKLDNLVHVGHNVEVGEDVVIAAQTGISGSSRIGAGAILGGQVGIADHVEIEAGAILGAQSGIPSNKVIRGKGIVFWGTPARPIREYLKELATLSRLSRKREK